MLSSIWGGRGDPGAPGGSPSLCFRYKVRPCFLALLHVPQESLNYFLMREDVTIFEKVPNSKFVFIFRNAYKKSE